MGESDPMLGRMLAGTYRLERVIGRGGTGVVYEASHRRLRRRFAVKVLWPALQSDREMLARFRREAEITSQLGHPHVLEVIDFDHADDGAPYMVMELLEGEDLADRLRREGALPLEEVGWILRQACSAVQAAHDEGVVHRDLKPRNVYLARRAGHGEHVKIVDFGISKVLGMQVELTIDRVLLGTPGYLSPEQALGRSGQVDARTDVFSMGAILYYLLAGTPPFEAEEQAAAVYRVVHDRPAPLRELRPELPDALVQVVDEALAKSVDERCPSMAELWRRFASAAGLPPEEQRLPSLAPPREPSADGAPTWANDTVVDDPPAAARVSVAGAVVASPTRRMSPRAPLRRRALAGGLLLATVAAVAAALLAMPGGAEQPEEPVAAAPAVADTADTAVADTAVADTADTAVADTATTSPAPESPPPSEPGSAEPEGTDDSGEVAAERVREREGSRTRRRDTRGRRRPRASASTAPGQLHVVAVGDEGPLWADVLVDGSALGQSPIDVALESGRAHRVVLRRAGFRTERRRVLLRPGERRRLVVTLARAEER